MEAQNDKVEGKYDVLQRQIIGKISKEYRACNYLLFFNFCERIVNFFYKDRNRRCEKRLAKLTYFLKDEKQELMEYDKRIVIKYT